MPGEEFSKSVFVKLCTTKHEKLADWMGLKVKTFYKVLHIFSLHITENWSCEKPYNKRSVLLILWKIHFLIVFGRTVTKILRNSGIDEVFPNCVLFKSTLRLIVSCILIIITFIKHFILIITLTVLHYYLL